jgi:hypothetical protein
MRALSLFDAIRETQKRLPSSQRGIRSMREPARQTSADARARRTCIAISFVDADKQSARRLAPGERRLRAEAQIDAWRRIEMGTNHIACFGVWRRGSRRQAARVNRTNSTRWHMPHQSDAVFTLVEAEKSEAALEA